MEEFDIEGFSERLKEIAIVQFGSIKNLSEKSGVANISMYTQKNAREPRASVLAKLANVGVDVNYLLTGNASQINSNTNEIHKLKAEIYDLREMVNDLRNKNKSIDK
ncbi:MAG: hypothetical protein IPM32_14485 [Ignavibacteriae bacterium]|nr:hypothetical protein [Ignavibacteriota bacterium]